MSLRPERLARPLALALLLVGCGGGGGGGGGGTAAPAAPPAPGGTGGAVTISLRGLQFRPASVTAAVGQPVVWRDDEDVAHTVTTGSWTAGGDGTRTSSRPDGLLDKVVDGTGSSVTYVFTRPGRYQYLCAYHARMQGVVVVR